MYIKKSENTLFMPFLIILSQKLRLNVGFDYLFCCCYDVLFQCNSKFIDINSLSDHRLMCNLYCKSWAKVYCRIIWSWRSVYSWIMSHQSSVGKCYQTNATNVLQHHRANRLCENKRCKIQNSQTWVYMAIIQGPSTATLWHVFLSVGV